MTRHANPTKRAATLALWILRTLLAVIAVFHLLVGGALWLSTDFQAWAVPEYLVKVQWNEQAVYLVRIVGSFAAVLGVFALLAVPDPWNRRQIVYGLAAFFVIRNVDRLAFFAEVNDAFGVTWMKNMQTLVGTSAMTLVMLVCLWMLRPR